MEDTNVKIELDSLTGLTSRSKIILVIGGIEYIFKPVSLRAFSRYEKLNEEDPELAKTTLVGECMESPEISIDELLEEEPLGLVGLLFNNLLRASFLLPPVSNE